MAGTNQGNGTIIRCYYTNDSYTAAYNDGNGNAYTTGQAYTVTVGEDVRLGITESATTFGCDELEGITIVGTVLLYNGTFYVVPETALIFTYHGDLPEALIFFDVKDEDDNTVAATQSGDLVSFAMPESNVTVEVYKPWGIEDGADGTATHPYLISSTEDLDLLAAVVNNGYDCQGKHFKLTNDLDYDETENSYTPIGNASVNSDMSAVIDNGFNGTFNGNGKTISGININKTGATDASCFQGVFGVVGSQGTVSNLTVTGTTILGFRYVGTIAAYNEGTISGCTVEDSVTLHATEEMLFFHGGIVGYNKGSVNTCTSSCKLTTSGVFTYNACRGGIVGYNDSAGSITGCFANQVSSHGIYGLGVIAGYNEGTLNNNYYYQCSVYVGANSPMTSGIGITTGSDYHYTDITENNGAVQVNRMILGRSVAADISPVLTMGSAKYYLHDSTVGLSYTSTLGYDPVFSVNGVALAGNSFTLNADANVTVTVSGVEETQLTMYGGDSYAFNIPAAILSFNYFTRSQYVIPATDLTNMAGSEITSLTYYTAIDGSYTTESTVNVYLKEVTYNTMTGLEPVTSTDIVYQGVLDIVGDDDGGKLTIDFSTLYYYEGGNLLVCIENTTLTEDCPPIYYHGEYVENAAWMGYGYSDPTEWTDNENFRPKTTITYVPGDAPAVMKPLGLAVNYTEGTTAEVSWNSDAEAFDIEVNGVVTENVTNPYTLTNLLYDTDYTVSVRGKSGDEVSSWSSPVNFRTDFCAPEDKCMITLDLSDKYKDTWDGNAIRIVDVLTGIQIGTYTLSERVKTMTLLAPVPDGREIQFVWVTGSYPTECSWMVYNAQHEILFSGQGDDEMEHGQLLYTYTVDCDNAIPYDVTVMPTAHTATFSWTGNSDSYQVKYRSTVVQEVFFSESFEGGMPSGWMVIDSDGDGKNWYQDTNGDNSHTGDGMMVSASYDNGGLTPDNWLISQQLNLQGTLSVWLRGDGENGSFYKEHFAVYLSTTGNNISDFTTVLIPETETTSEYQEYLADLSAYTGQQGYIAIRHFNCEDEYRLYMDDFALLGFEEWTTVTTTETSCQITGLTPGVTYDYTIVGITNNIANAGTTLTNFTTIDGMDLTVEGHHGGNGGWVFIASPVATDGGIEPTTVNNLMADPAEDYDLYKLVNTTWANYKPHDGNIASGFNLINGQGYLYATKETKTLTFAGTFNTATEMTISGLPQGYNLVGNPFTVNAYVNKPYYTLNSDGSAIVAKDSNEDQAIPPCHGVIVEVGENETITFNTSGEFSVGPNNGGLNVALTQALVTRDGTSMKTLDNAIVSFNQGEQLGKFYFGSQSANIYIPQNGEEYAIVNAEAQGEMPLCFKANQNGTYTLNISSDEVAISYLHLIDNLTGNDVDLLQTSSYTFEGRTTDYTSRFKLVFSANGEDGPSTGSGTFAFISNGNIIVNGEGTLQIVDLMGRILVNTDTTRNVSTNGLTAGVYVLRLINGEKVRVQKIVIE